MPVKDHCTRARHERKSNPPKSAPSFIMMPRAICDDPSLTPTERVLLTILTGYAFGDKPECYPSTATLAKKLGRHRDHVRRMIRGLQARGYLVRRQADNRTGREILLGWRLASLAPPPPPSPSPSSPPPPMARIAPPAAPSSPMTVAEERAELVAMCQNPCPSFAALGRRRLEKFDAELAARAVPVDPPQPVPLEPVPTLSEPAPGGGADALSPWALMPSPPWAQAPTESKEEPSKKGTGAGGFAAQVPPPVPQKTPEPPARRAPRRDTPRAPHARAIRTPTPVTAFEALMDAPIAKAIGLGRLRDLSKMSMVTNAPAPPPAASGS